MKFSKFVTNIFYKDIQSGLNTFVNHLKCTMGFRELVSHRPFFVDEKDGLKIMLFQDSKYAEEHNPEFRLETDNIEEVYERVSTQFPEMLHPNHSKVTHRPWGAQEFAIIDDQLGVIIQQW